MQDLGSRGTVGGEGAGREEVKVIHKGSSYQVHTEVMRNCTSKCYEGKLITCKFREYHTLIQ